MKRTLVLQNHCSTTKFKHVASALSQTFDHCVRPGLRKGSANLKCCYITMCKNGFHHQVGVKFLSGEWASKDFDYKRWDRLARDPLAGRLVSSVTR